MTDRRRALLWRGVGQDLESYVTVGVAVMVSLLDLFGVVEPSVVSAATLGILALISFNLLNGRRQTRQTEVILARLTRAIRASWSMDQVVTAADRAGDLEFDRARDIRLVGVTLSRTVRTHLPALTRCLAAGGTVRVVVIDPDSGAEQEAARRSGLPDDAEVYRHRLRPTLDLLHHLASLSEARGRIQVRMIRYVPSFGLMMVDPESPGGVARVEIYSHRPGVSEPTLTLTAERDPRWFQHFLTEFHPVWERARPLPAFSGQDHR